MQVDTSASHSTRTQESPRKSDLYPVGVVKTCCGVASGVGCRASFGRWKQCSEVYVHTVMCRLELQAGYTVFLPQNRTCTGKARPHRCSAPKRQFICAAGAISETEVVVQFLVLLAGGLGVAYGLDK